MKYINILRKYRYELIALLMGAAIMMLEITGARLIAPFFGASVYVWTAMIGVILSAMSLGFWAGGRLADRDEPSQELSVLIAGAAFFVMLMAIVQQPVLDIIAKQELDLRLSAILAATILFGVPSVLIGMVSPHLAKIKVTSLSKTGSAVGRLEAAGAIGSITGTFLSGYFLLSFFGARSLTIWLAILLLLTSFLASRHRYVIARLGLFSFAMLLLFTQPNIPKVVADVDSSYSRYQVIESKYNDRPVHLLVMDRVSIQSASYIDNPTELVLPYSQTIVSSITEHVTPRDLLIIGGGTYTIPTALQAALPDSRIDVIEIDPMLDELASEFFEFRAGPNIRVIHEDGRSYLNRSSRHYDVVVVDAFSSLTPPFQLTSREAVNRIKDNLGNNGVVIVNIPANYYGDFLPAVTSTYESIFSNVNIYKSRTDQSLDEKQNFILIASNNEKVAAQIAPDLTLRVDNHKNGLVLTDDYAPVERLTH